MFALLCFVLAVLVLPFKARSRLEAENAAAQGAGPDPAHEQRSLVFRPAVCTENLIRID
jgi:hypothetical protein